MDLALDEAGAQIAASTSFDANYPPSNVLDGDQATRWLTTGSFPQEIILQLATAGSISRVKLWGTNVKEVAVETCAGPTPSKWERLYEAKFAENDGNLQMGTENVKTTNASFVRFKVLSGWTNFAALHRVSVEGMASRR